MNQHILLGLGGFATPESRGVVSYVGAELPSDIQYRPVSLDQVDPSSGNITIPPFDTQVDMLQAEVTQVRLEHPEAIMDVVAHSESCVIVALAGVASIRRTIFLAPPAELLDQAESIEWIRTILDGRTNIAGNTTFPFPGLPDVMGTVTQAFWKSREDIDPLALYREHAGRTALTIMRAERYDRFADRADFSSLPPSVEVMTVDGADLNFTEDARLVAGELILAKLAEPVIGSKIVASETTPPVSKGDRPAGSPPIGDPDRPEVEDLPDGGRRRKKATPPY